MGKIISIFSGKGGVGKTTVAVNLALAMHKLAEDVIVVDCDLKNPNLGLHLEVFDYDKTLHDFLTKNLSLLECIHIHPTGLKFIPSHLSLEYLNVNFNPALSLKEIFADISTQVILDSAPGLNEHAIRVLESCDEVLVVTTPYLPDVTACIKTIQIARDIGIRVRGIILNRIGMSKYEISKEEIESISNTKVIQSIPWDKNVLKSLAVKTPVVEYKPYSPASVAFYELASKLSGRKYRKPKFLRLKRLFLG